MKGKKAIVAGSGIAGIACAIRLACRGYNVSVYEANAYPGGKLSAFSMSGFRFDAGPSLFTMPAYVDELFELAGEDPRQYFNYIKLGNAYRYFYADGSTFSPEHGKAAFAADMQNANGEDSKSVERFLNKSAYLYELTRPVFLERSLHKLSTYTSKAALKGILNLWRLNMFATMHRANLKAFRNSKTVQFFDRFATYNGSDPYQAPATLNLIPHLELHYGVFFPEGGMHSITSALVKLAENKGVRFIYNSPVKEIHIEKGKALGVILQIGDIQQADVVISNMDVYHTYKKLMPSVKAPRRTETNESSSSALIFYWGIKGTFPQFDLHNILFSGNYKAEFDHLFKTHTLYEDPTVYINISSKYEQADAPAGMENWFVMVNAPANYGQDWDRITSETRQRIIHKLSSVTGRDISSLITCEAVLDPRSIESKTSSWRGALYGSSSNKRLAAFLRHPNFSSRIKNLYFCGGSVHPGGGIPLCLLSARIVDGLIKKTY